MNDNVVKKNDYELYLMNVPLTLFGKKRRQYIKRQLEKVHPCFSEQFSFDSKRCMRKGRLQTLIAVMDKVKVLEYRGKKNHGLHLEGVRTGTLFKGKNMYSVLLLMIVAALFLTLTVVTSVKNKISGTELNVVEDSYDFRSQALAVIPERKKAGEILEAVFQRIEESGGEIRNMSVEVESGGQDSLFLLNLSLEKMYPENIINELDGERNLNVSAVSYSESKPNFECSMEEDLDRVDLLKLNAGQVSGLRNLLSQYCSIKEEDFLKAAFHCELMEGDFLDLFKKINSTEGLAVKKISISRIKGGYDLCLAFADSNEDADKGICLAFLNHSSLFAGKKTAQSSNGMRQAAVKRMTAKEKVLPSWEKIGRVVQKNGRTIVYYRDEKNQIKGVEE